MNDCKKLLEPTVWETRVFDGTWDIRANAYIKSKEVSTGATIAHTGLVDSEQVSRAAAIASEAQENWLDVPYNERAEILRSAARMLNKHSSEVEGWLVREAGSTRGKAASEINRAIQECHAAASLAADPTGEVLSTDSNVLSLSRRLPVGVVGVIAPFNYPLGLAMGVVAPALSLGNAVLLKPDTRTAVSGGIAIARIFEMAGLPSGLLHVLPGGADVGEAVIADPVVSTISFTGSSSTGKKVAELAAHHHKRVHLELGGNSAIMVLEDADMDSAVSAAAWASYLHQGQICMTAGRHIVHEDLIDEYALRLSRIADALRVGDPAADSATEIGPIIDESQRDRVHNMVSTALEAGAHLCAGGSYDGLYYRPTVLTNISPKMSVWTDEVFGPVAPIHSVSTIDEAVALAKDTDYGLVLSILTKDVMKAFEISRKIPSGVVHINDQTIADDANVPFGGVLKSGNGSRIGSARANLDAFTITQWLTMRGEIPYYSF